MASAGRGTARPADAMDRSARALEDLHLDGVGAGDVQVEGAGLVEASGAVLRADLVEHEVDVLLRRPVQDDRVVAILGSGVVPKLLGSGGNVELLGLGRRGAG